MVRAKARLLSNQQCWYVQFNFGRCHLQRVAQFCQFKLKLLHIGVASHICAEELYMESISSIAGPMACIRFFQRCSCDQTAL